MMTSCSVSLPHTPALTHECASPQRAIKAAELHGDIGADLTGDGGGGGLGRGLRGVRVQAPHLVLCRART